MKIFISYSRKDYDWVKKLHLHLSPLIRSGKLTLLSDMDVLPGQVWERQIRKFLESADVVILLISPEYLASDFIGSVEIPSLLQMAKNNQTKIIPVLIRETLLEGEILKLPFFDSLSRPLDSLSEHKQDNYFHKLSKTIHKLVPTVDTRIIEKPTKQNRLDNAIHSAILNTGSFNLAVSGDGNIFIQAENGVNARNDKT